MALLGCAWWELSIHSPALGCRLTSVTDELAVATKEVLSRQEMVSQLQNELRSEEENTHPRER